MVKILLLLISFNLYADEFLIYQIDNKFFKFIKKDKYLISAGSSKDSMAYDAIKKIPKLKLEKNHLDYKRDLGAIICQKYLKEKLLFSKNNMGEIIPVCKFMDNSMIDTLGIQKVYLLNTSP